MTTFFVLGWAVNAALFALFAALGLIDAGFWRRPVFWAALATPFSYVVLAVALAWQQIDRW